MRLPLLQAGRDWLWAASVPALPEIADDDTASAGEMLLAYNALAESIATSQPGLCRADPAHLRRHHRRCPSRGERLPSGACSDI